MFGITTTKSKFLILFQVLSLTVASFYACKKENKDDTQNLLLAAVLLQNAGGAGACARASSPAYAKASNTGPEDSFGSSVDLDGDVMVMGAPDEDSSAKTINGDAENDDAPNSGAAYVFVCENGAWRFDAYLKAPNAETGDKFGSSVAVSGNTLLVTAPFEGSSARGVNGDQNQNDAAGSGAAYVFERVNGVWEFQAYLKSANSEAGDSFGTVADISGDSIVIGAPAEDGIQKYVNAPDSNGALSSGAAYVFRRSGTTWIQEAYLKSFNAQAFDGFGNSVAISGETVAVGATGEASSAQGVGGNENDNSARGAGAVYVFSRSAVTWTQEAYLKASNTDNSDNYEEFGSAVALSGDTIVVGAVEERSSGRGVNGEQNNNDLPGSGAAYVFMRTGNAWSQQAYLKADNAGETDNFGLSVAVSGDLIVVGAPYEDGGGTGVNGQPENDDSLWSGAVYIYKRESNTWNLAQYRKASNAESRDFFGHSTAIYENTILVGAREEAGKSTGLNGDQSNNESDDAGAAYLFHLDD